MKIQKPQSKRLPVGVNTLIFRKWELGKTKNGDPKIVLTHSDETGGVIIKDHVRTDDKYGYIKLVSFINAFGFDIEDAIDTDLFDQLLAGEFQAITTNEMFNNIEDTRIAEYLPAVNVESSETKREEISDENEPVEPVIDVRSRAAALMEQHKKNMERLNS